MNFWEELMLILEKENQSLQALKELAYDKTDIIINNDIIELEKLTKKEEAFIDQLANIEEERTKFMDTWGISKETPLAKIIDKAVEGKEELMQIGLELSRALDEIQSRNNTNRQLINENLEWLDFNMNLLTTHTQTIYGKEPKGLKIKNSLFDRKV